MNEVMLEAPAKINLYLEVKGRREDGYHEIESLMQKLELADRLRLTRGEKGVRLSCCGAGLPENEDNLAFRAAKTFMNHAAGGCLTAEAGVDIVLEKKIPIAAGLGGGSSDAAAVLRGLAILFGMKISAEELLSMAKGLGADVPFFVADWAAAWATGIGDQLEKADPIAGYQIVLVNPGFPVSTKWAYENFALTTKGNTFILARNPESAKQRPARRSEIVPDRLYNDLETVTVSRFPELEHIKRKLQQDGAVGVLMSGSGPTVFGLFTDKNRALQSFTRFSHKYGKNVFITRPYRSC